MVSTNASFEIFNISGFFFAGLLSLVMILGITLILTAKKTKYSFLGFFCLLFSLGMVISTGMIADILFIKNKNSDNFSLLNSFAILIILISFLFLYKYIIYKENNESKSQQNM